MVPMEKTHPAISVIIPSTDGSRGGNVSRLKQDLKRQTWPPDEVLVVVGVKPNGRARNVGAQRAKGEYLLFLDDDVRLGHQKVVENLVKPFLHCPRLGATGASQRPPKGASLFQQMVSFQLPRMRSPFFTRPVESDLVTHWCICLPAKLYHEVGQEDPDLVRGTDPDLRVRLRRLGYSLKIVPHTWVYHPPPEDFKALLRTAFRNGLGSAWVFRTTPDKVYEAPSFYATKEILPFYQRWLRRAVSPWLHFFSGSWLKAVYDLVYISGYAYGMLAAPEKIKDSIF